MIAIYYAIKLVVFIFAFWALLHSINSITHWLSRKSEIIALASCLGILSLTAAVEQTYLQYVADPAAEHDFLQQEKLVKDYMENNGGGDDLGYKTCFYTPVSVAYDYKLCIISPSRGISGGEPGHYLLYGVRPAGYLTLIPRQSSSRDDWDRFNIGEFSMDDHGLFWSKVYPQ